MARRFAALGFKVRTGRATFVAVTGSAQELEISAKTRIDVAFTFEEGAVYHSAQQLPLDRARALLHEAEACFAERARAELEVFVAQLDRPIISATMVARPEKALPPLETILKAHPLLHAAEGQLYRRVFEDACTALGVRPGRIAEDGLAKLVASALGISSGKLETRLAAIGKASGKPWAVEQKQCTLAAWLALASL